MRSIAVVVLLTLPAAACGSTSPDAAESGGATTPSQTEATETQPTSPPEVPVLTDVAFTPGGLAVGQVEIDGTTIDYVTVVPEGFELGDTAPVLLAMPPGGQDLELTQTIVDGVYQTEAIARGWVVVSPAAPDGQLYFQGSEALIGGLLRWMAGWVDAEGGLPHLSGISNGGISAFRVLAENPTGFRSLLVFPGFPRSDDDKAALENLADVPIRMFVGETDEGWATAMDAAFRTLTDSGADVTFDVVAGEGHIIRSMGDGIRLFDELDAIQESVS